jgi:hypothetical protein
MGERIVTLPAVHRRGLGWFSFDGRFAVRFTEFLQLPARNAGAFGGGFVEPFAAVCGLQFDAHGFARA